jgi:eukaryotic-like serine/threonine-protein kinase
MIGQKLGSFLIEAELGSGAMGIVYRGVRESGKTRVAAVKVISLEQMAKGKGFERFIREAEILEQFRHPNIVRYLARGKSGKIFYYAMEFIPGSTLDGLLDQRGALPWPEVVNFGIQLCDALHYAHEHSVVHRDLKPSNLMVTKEGQLKLTDFGIAKDLDATALTATGRTLGTAAYMAPEQIRGTPEVSHKTDLYALGILLYQMLTGEMPFQGSSAVVLMHCHMNEAPPRPSNKTAVIPVALDDLVLKLMAKTPADRPWDAAAVGVILRELRELHESKQPIPMVWPEEGSPAANPTRMMDTTRPKEASGKKKKKKKSAAQRLRAAAPTIGLVAALVAIAAAIGYVVWPVSAQYLYAQAEPLMASKERSDWLHAKEYFLEELDRRYPNHPYKKQTEEWLDKIALTGAEGRAKNLVGGVGGFGKADTPGERSYVSVFPEAAESLKRHDDLDAVRRWRQMAADLEKNDARSERGWILLARDRALTLEIAIAERARLVSDGIAQAKDYDRQNQPDQALERRRSLLKLYGEYTDTRDALKDVREKVPADPPPPTEVEKPASSDKPAASKPG